jgi:hypothetical protein
MTTEENKPMFVDEERVSIPHPETWGDMSFDQLLDVRSKLYAKFDASKRVEAYRKPIQRAIDRVQSMIEAKVV